MLKKSGFLLSSLLMISLASCQNTTNLQELPTDESGVSSKRSDLAPYTLQAWRAHINDVRSKGDLQSGCSPFYKLAEGKALGSVVLFHGFSACPQQYEEISNLLAQKGYNVFVPLLPGHGKQQILVNGKLEDNSGSLPDMDSIKVYDDFAKNMGTLIKDEKGTKVIGGLSVGGAIATKAMVYHQEIYDRAILMAPFFNASGTGKFLLPALGEVIPNKKWGWGDECEDERRGGRAGYCNFKLGNVAAVRKFGVDTLKLVSQIRKPVQITGVEKDPAASNAAIAEAYKNMPNAEACLFAKGANHSMLSKQDNLGVNMFWLDSLESQFVRYVDTGRSFEVVGNSDNNLGLCKSY